MTSDLYGVLGVRRDATVGDIRQAYRRAVQCERDERLLEQEKQQIERALEILRDHDFDVEKVEMRGMGYNFGGVANFRIMG